MENLRVRGAVQGESFCVRFIDFRTIEPANPDCLHAKGDSFPALRDIREIRVNIYEVSMKNWQILAQFILCLPICGGDELVRGKGHVGGWGVSHPHMM